MRVVIVGAGKVGKHIATSLAAGGHHVLVLDSSRTVVAEAQQPLLDAFVDCALADGCEVTSLENHDLRSADVVVAATGDDEDNLVVSLLAKQEFAVPRVVARVNHPKNLWLFNETWGVDVPVSAPHLLTAAVEGAVTAGRLVQLLSLGAGATIEEVRLPDTSPAVGSTISALGLPRTCTIVAVIRDTQVIVPRGDTNLDAGDEILLLTTETGDETIAALLVGRPEEVARVRP